MKLGLKRGVVELYDHDVLWEENACEIIKLLKSIFGDNAIDIQHIGSTAIKTIKAKPIIDIVVGINDFNLLEDIMYELNDNGIIHRPNNDMDEYKLFVIGDFEKDTRTHHIHVVKYDNVEWNNQLDFRDYLNNYHEEAKKYEELKIELMEKNKDNREKYTKNKEEYLLNTFEKAKEWKKNRRAGQNSLDV
ncbi:MAG: GrpB family protein [Treponema sp.]|jgi:GrpB-like predicted nucleotidyltransferase (UPF0157 family)|nr:GrpB family protein [Treponema sp.]